MSHLGGAPGRRHLAGLSVAAGLVAGLVVACGAGTRDAVGDRAGAGGGNPGFGLAANILADYVAVDSVGPDLRHRGHHRAYPGRIRRGRHGVVQSFGESETLTLLVNDRYNRGAEYGAYALSTLMVSVAVTF